MAMVRHTRQRAAVIEVLQASREHPDAAAIHAAVRERLPSVSLGTVYRTLDALVRDGVVVTLERAGQATRYDWRAGTAHHHAVCRSCGAIFDVDALTLPGVPAAGLPGGFRVTDVHLEFMGVCVSCQAASSGAATEPAGA
ncbi:Fur family ferric uptake transcriptional regulator [Deinococcus metalli]|uniref:Fur family ferric uptake transcriptional regulator n=1 Tax=Deinococcus metalli TaxID=1141878 RepID=A0A7W8KDD2_9DEIO|nr:transcriptional repressor [Deinococcus metalli]MBB5376089.1 Fur family ferric uptake transcriptional regulator [Deinococcus metalli]GHF40882.1 transcriptional repressor [Deinococcus metalli]